MKRLVISIVILFGAHQLAGQNIISTNKSFNFKSETLKEDRKIQIYLPEKYNETSTKYPVLYVVDSQRYFLNGIVFQKNLTWQKLVPDFIIVGITTERTTRRKQLYQDSAKFITFLEKELIPFIDKKYNTLDQRIYFGWEMAAGLGVQILGETPGLFNGYLLSSPTYISKTRLENVKTLLENSPKNKLYIYASLGTVENWAIEPMLALDSIFKQHPNINWEFNLSENDNHYTTPLVTINKGLRGFFSDFGPIRFYTLKEFAEFGGFTALKKHYKHRGNKYQVSTDIHTDTKHYLLLQSHKENDFELFEKLMNGFNGKTFIEEYYNHGRWFVRFASFYLSNNKLEDALEILELGLKKTPNASILHNEMGNYYKAKGKQAKAKKWYKKAILIAEKNNEPQLLEYKKNLKKAF